MILTCILPERLQLAKKHLHIAMTWYFWIIYDLQWILIFFFLNDLQKNPAEIIKELTMIQSYTIFYMYDLVFILLAEKFFNGLI